jgi:integrase
MSEIEADLKFSAAAYLRDLAASAKTPERQTAALSQAGPSRAAPTAQRPIGTRQFARLVDEWVTGIGLQREDYGTHSHRRTKASIIYKAAGNLRTVQLLLGHTKIESTVRYLGVDVEDALNLAEHTEV